MPEYVTAYEISGQSSGWPFACIGLIPLLVGSAIIFGKIRFKWRRPNWFLACSWFGFGLLWIATVGAGILKNESDAFAAFQRGDYSMVEGVVTDFHPMPYEGHDDECFSVQQQRFCYSDYVVTPGFHNAASHGGPIRPGLSVRVAYSGSTILRLEIAKAQLQTPSQTKAAAESAEKDARTRSENDPMQQSLGTAFFLTAVGLTLLWNLQWKRTIGFWMQPPYRRATQYAFRVFFALNFIGAITGLVEQLIAHPISRQNLGATMTATAIMYAVVGIGYAFGLWILSHRQNERA